MAPQRLAIPISSVRSKIGSGLKGAITSYPYRPGKGESDSAVEGISDADFQRIRELVQSSLGLSIPSTKRVMVETRLRKRARALGMESMAAYCQYVYGAKGRGQEWPHLVDAITTHKTDFFREPSHFDFLVKHAVPELMERSGAGSRRDMLLRSAACSTGEEPYTLAIVMSEYAEAMGPRGCRFRVHASDISRGVLETAGTAIYSEGAVEPVPEAQRSRYLLRSRNPEQRQFRMTPAIRGLVSFRQLNLVVDDYNFAEPIDIVFCRNVLIYFNRETQQGVLSRICRVMQPGGYLFMGHAESLNGLDLPLQQIEPTVYRRRDA